MRIGSNGEHHSICKGSNGDGETNHKSLNREMLIVIEGRQEWKPACLRSECSNLKLLAHEMKMFSADRKVAGLRSLRFLLLNGKRSNGAKKIGFLSPKGNRSTNLGAMSKET
jgi:hypothetical protein